MKIKKWQIFAITGTILALGVGIYFLTRKTITVREIPIKQRVVKRTVSSSGLIKSVNEANLAFPTIGRLYDIAVLEGDVVKKGAYIAMLDNYAESKSAQSLNESLDAAIKDKELFIENYETNKDDVGGSDEYEIQLKKYQDLVEKAEASYQAQLGTVGKSYIYAPFDGEVIDVYYDPGETVTVGAAIIKLARPDELIFEVQLDQEDFVYLEVNQEVEITLDAYEDETFYGKVIKVPKYVNSTSGSDFTLEIEFVDQANEKLLLGMTGDAFIILTRTETEVPALTFDEIRYDIDDEPYVFIEQNGIVKRKYLETGLQGDIYTEIKSSFENPIISATNSNQDLEEGMRVNLRK